MIIKAIIAIITAAIIETITSSNYSATGYARLAKSLIDIVKEQQAKLGYRKEIVRLYYPLSTLRHFFECAGADNKIATGMISEQQMLEILAPNKPAQTAY